MESGQWSLESARRGIVTHSPPIADIGGGNEEAAPLLMNHGDGGGGEGGGDGGGGAPSKA